MSSTASNDPLIIASRSFQSRLMIGTGKFPSTEALRQAIAASGSEIITVALRRVDLSNPEEQGILSAIDPARQLILPNTSGARNADEAVRLAKLAGPQGWSRG
jgi:thiazole synthase